MKLLKYLLLAVRLKIALLFLVSAEPVVEEPAKGEEEEEEEEQGEYDEYDEEEGEDYEEDAEYEEDEEDPVIQPDEDYVYNPEDEPIHFPCRRDPTWRNVEYEACQELSEWYPDDTWWRVDTANTEKWLGENEGRIWDCLDNAFEEAKKTHAWANCDEFDRTEVCAVESVKVLSHYFRVKQGQLVTLSNVLSEQEAFGVEALSDCIREILPNELPFYEAREFETDTSETQGMYNYQGGNYCTFFQGLLQHFLPGVTAAIYVATQQVYDEARWAELEYPAPLDLSIRTAEYLHYKTTGKLGSHVDGGSVYSISIALSNEDDYEGGYFQLETAEALFKVPRLSAIVFLSESVHSITEISSGERKVFVTEFWANEDTPVGIPRPTEEQFEAYKEERRPLLPVEEEQEEEEEHVHEEMDETAESAEDEVGGGNDEL